MEILQGLNDAQKQALLQIKGAVLVTAGAGSGKTKLLTHRIAYLVEHEHVDEKNILAITFTNKAAKEMKDRVSVLLQRPNNNIWISTFHSMCLKILRQYVNRLQGYTLDFSIYSESDSEKLLKQVIKDLNLPLDNYKHYASVISHCQNQNVDIYMYAKNFLNEQDELEKVYESYENALKQNNAMDFDNLLTKTYELLSCNKDVLEYFANMFEYVFVDEFQDTNVIQYDLIKLLTSVHKNIFVVGDEDQCIYTWRGANFKNIFNFKKDFAPVKMFKLEQNYRSTKEILNKANKLIANNNERFDKVLWTDNSDGKNVEVYQYYDEQTEAESVVSKIWALVSNSGYDYKDIAILMRMNALTLPFEQKLLNYNMPYRIYGGFKFYERQEIKNVVSYLRIFVNPNDEISLLRIINFPKRGIGDGAIEKLRTYAHDNGLSLLDGTIKLYNNKEDNPSLYSKIELFAKTYLSIKEQMQNLRLDEFVNLVIEGFEIKSAYIEKTDEDTEKLMNIDVFVNSIYEFCNANPTATLTEYLESITLESDIDYMGVDDTITISTIHSVKGLEFKVVFIVGVEEGIFPISRSFESASQIEEERRLMYVAITRAKERLFVSYVNTRYLHGKRSYTRCSRFLDEANLSIPTKPKTYTSFDFEDRNEYYDKIITKPSVFSSVNKNGYIQANKVEEKEKKDTSLYKAGQKIKHPKFGYGVIQAIVDDGECADILFDSFGKKTLILEIAPLEIIE